MSELANVSVGICWYSVMSAWRAGDMPVGRLFDFAKEIGADSVELLDAFLYEPGVVRDHLPTDETISQFVFDAKAGIERTGIVPSAISVTNDFNHDDPARLKIERNKIALGIQLARELGAKAVRVFSGNPSSSDDIELVRYRTIDALRDLADNDVVLALENHGNVFATPSRILSILDPLEETTVGSCFDIGNFVLADADPVDAAKVLPWPSLIHVKDFRPAEDGGYRSPKGIRYQGCRLGAGVVPILETLAVLRDRSEGRTMQIDLELECGDDGIEASRAGVTWLKSGIRSVLGSSS